MATELIGIELELRGEDEVFADLRKLDNMLAGFSGAKGKHTIELDLGQSQQKLLALRGEINKTGAKIEDLKRKIEGLRKMRSFFNPGTDAYNELSDQINDVTESLERQKAHLKDTQMQYKDTTQRVNELRYALKNFSQVPFTQLFSKMSMGLKHIGQNAQTLGNTLTKLGTPFRSITQGALYGTGYKLLNMATEGISSGFTRYDTMKKYTRMMAEYETANYSAEQSKKDLDAAVQGLPTALDEIMSVAQRYTLSLGDMRRGTKLAIATNNAFLASMATEQQQYQGMLQLQDLMNGKKLQSREWMSLTSSMGKAVNEIAKLFGAKSQKEIQAFRQQLNAGKIDTEEFLDALIKVGTGEGSLVKLADMSKTTYEALSRNIRTAFSRMGAGILESLDEVSKAYNGKTLIANLAQSKKVIDGWTASIKEWIQAHPEEITDFVEKLKGLDFKGFGEGVLEGMKAIKAGFDLVGDFAGSRGLKWLGYLVTIGGPLGRAITLMGGALKGLSHPIALVLATLAKFGIMGAGEIRKRTGGSLIGRIASLFGSKKEMAQIPTAAPTVMESLKGTISGLQGVLTAAGTIAIAAGTGFVAFKSVKSMMSDLKGIIDITSKIDWVQGAKVIGNMAIFFGAFAGLGAIVGTGAGIKAGIQVLFGEAIIGTVTTLAAGFAALDMKLVKSMFTSLEDMSDSIIRTIDNLNRLKSINNVGEIKKRLKDSVTLFNQLRDIVSGEDTGHGTIEGGLKNWGPDKVGTIKNIGSIVDSFTETFKTIPNMLNAMQKASDALDPTSGNMVLYEPLIKRLSTMFDKFDEIYDASNKIDGDASSLASKMENFAKAFESIRVIFRKLRKISRIQGGENDKNGKIGGLTSVKSLLTQLEGTFNAARIEPLNSQIQNFVSQLNNLLDAVRKINTDSGNITIKINLKDKITGKAEVIRDIANIARDISTVIRNMQKVFVVPISVHFRANVNSSDAIRNINSGSQKIMQNVPLTEQSGGVIYRANGGIAFRPRGTDTIPAMLTPGEFVHRRDAVDVFGLDFMNKINNLDVRGAMKALMSRVGNSTNIGRQSVVNNTVNNNQRVNMTVHSDNPDVIKVRMGRFAGAF